MYEFVSHPAITYELKDSIKWYDSKSSRTAENFKAEIKKSLFDITVNPFLFQKIYNDYRAYPIKNFPFRIIYYIEDDVVFILSVFHTSKNPEIWKNRKFE